MGSFAGFEIKVGSARSRDQDPGPEDRPPVDLGEKAARQASIAVQAAGDGEGKIAIALPRSPIGNAAMTIAETAGNISAAPAPLDDSEDDDQASAPPSRGCAQSADAAAKIRIPVITIRPVPGDIG